MTFTRAAFKSFPGQLDLEGQPVPASLVFGDGVVQLLMAGEVVGSWLSDEIEIDPVGSAFELRAEGEALGFTPLQMDSFQAFLSGDPDYEAEQVQESILTTPSALEEEWALPDEDSPLEAKDEEVVGDEWPAEEAITETADAIEADQEGSDAENVTETAAFADTDTFTLFDTEGLGAESQEPTTEPAPDPSARSSDDPAVVSADAGSGLGEISPGTSDPAGQPERSDTNVDLVDEADPAPSTEAPHHSPELVEDQEPATEVPTRAKKPRASLLSRMARPTQTDSETSQPLIETPSSDATSGVEGSESEEDDTPVPIDDAENLRQWRLVIAIGAGALVILIGLIWGVASLFGGEGDESLDEAATVTTVEVARQAPPAVGNPVTPPVAPDTPEPEIEEPAFVADWNRLAGQYAAHFRIDPQPLPISTALAPTVHLIYDESGTLRLDMVPTGTGSDRDILIAMGLAVAWADPTLEPDARRDLLGALGVDVDNPSLAEIGGELTRNEMSYVVTVGEKEIRFEITSAS